MIDTRSRLHMRCPVRIHEFVSMTSHRYSTWFCSGVARIPRVDPPFTPSRPRLPLNFALLVSETLPESIDASWIRRLMDTKSRLPDGFDQASFLSIRTKTYGYETDRFEARCTNGCEAAWVDRVERHGFEHADTRTPDGFDLRKHNGYEI